MIKSTRDILTDYLYDRESYKDNRDKEWLDLEKFKEIASEAVTLNNEKCWMITEKELYGDEE